jgi:HlyD family secretion protein
MAPTNRASVTAAPRGKVKLNKPRSIARSLIEFQPDAVEIEKRSVPGGARWTLYTVIALLAATVAWAYWAQVDRIVVARGSLVTTEPPIIIQPLSSAPIDRIFVRFGDIVRPNDILATLDRTFAEADVAIYRAKKESLLANVARLAAEQNKVDFVLGPEQTSEPWKSQAQAFLARRNEYTARMETFDAEREKTLAQIESSKSKIETLIELVDNKRKLHKTISDLRTRGSVSEKELMDSYDSLLQAEHALNDARSNDVQLNQDLRLNEKRRAEYVAHWESETSTQLADAQKELNQVAEELNKANRMNEYVDLRVPSDLGHDAYFVQEVAERSTVAKPSESLFKLVPLDVGTTGLEAEIEIESRDTGKLQGNETVRIKMDAFPFQKHGTLRGSLQTISEGTFTKGEGPAAQIIYKARVGLDSTEHLKNMPSGYRLLPGSTITAEIKVGKRRVIEYFLYPLLRYLDDSIREP